MFTLGNVFAYLIVLAIIYIIVSFLQNHIIVTKTKIDKEKPTTNKPTTCDIEEED